MYKDMKKTVYKDIQNSPKNMLCMLYNRRKMFLTRKGLSIRKRIVLRIDIGVYATKAPFLARFC